MATGTAVVVAAALAAGAAGAGVVLLVGSPPSSLPSPAADASRLTDLEERIARQEQAIGALRASLEEARHARPLPPLPGPGGPGAPGQVPPRPESGPGEPGDPRAETLDPAEFEARFKEMREKEQEDLRRTRAAESESALRARLDRDTALGLTDEQKDAVVKIQMDRAAKLRALFEEARAAGTPEAFRTATEKSAAARDEARRALEGILTPEQLTALERIERPGRPGQFGTRGGRPGGREGTGGGRRRPAGGGGTEGGGEGGDTPR